MEFTQAVLCEWFDYDPESGVLSWRKRPERGGMSCKVGDFAGSLQKTPDGKRHRRVLFLKGRRITAARAAYIMVYGDLQRRALIDHANGDTLDDRIKNLRLASAVQNAWNKVAPDGATYAKGVSRGLRGRYKARITGSDGRKINLGTWETEAEAHAAYMGASAVMHGSFSVGARAAPAERQEPGKSAFSIAQDIDIKGMG